MSKMVAMKSPLGSHRQGFSIVETLVAVGIIALLLALLLPAIQQARSAARRTQCTNNLRQIGLAIHNYHDQSQLLPPFNIWSGPPGEPLGGGRFPIGLLDRVARGLAPGTEPDRTGMNWLISLLPFLDQGPLYQKYDSLKPVSATENEAVRTAELAVFKCPDDPFSRAGEYYQRDFLASTDKNRYARGNYGMNIGPDGGCVMVLQPGCTNGFTVDDPDLVHKNMTLIGTGVGGFNASISFAQVTIGQSNMVAVDELRAGVHRADPRGTWALGFVGASGTMRHGLLGMPNNDGGGPNNQLADSDDIIGCAAVRAALDPDLFVKSGMPCFKTSSESNGQATSRSLHHAGVHVLMLDGSVHFVSDLIDLNIWYNMHKRDSTESIELPF